VVVPNFNGGARLRHSVGHILAIPLVDRLVLADDRSTDGSAELEETDRLSFKRNEGRRGFAATANVGIKNLLRTAAPTYIAVANSDLDFGQGFRHALELGVQHLEVDRETYLCGFNDAMCATNSAPSPCRGTALPVDSVSGCPMLFRSSIFSRIG